jgi:hypothetical protein
LISRLDINQDPSFLNKVNIRCIKKCIEFVTECKNSLSKRNLKKTDIETFRKIIDLVDVMKQYSKKGLSFQNDG